MLARLDQLGAGRPDPFVAALDRSRGGVGCLGVPVAHRPHVDLVRVGVEQPVEGGEQGVRIAQRRQLVR